MPDPMDQILLTYQRMVDDELLELAAAPNELTPEARTALWAELGRRGITDEAMQAAESMPAPAAPQATVGGVNWSVVPESQGGAQDSEWVAVSSAESEAEARETQELLQASGIASQLQIVVLTNQADAARAFDILSEKLDGEQER